LKVTLRKEGNQYHWYHKTFLVHQRFRFGFLTVFDLNRSIFQKNNFLVGWQFKPDTVGFLRAEVSDFRQSNLNLSNPQTYFDTLTGDIIHKINSKSKFGFEVHQYLFRHHTTLDKIVLDKLKQFIKFNIALKK